MSKFDDLKNNYRHDSSSHDWPFLVPMLDVVFILLFFFIVMSNTAQYVFDINLPKPDSSYSNPVTETNPDKDIKVFIKANVFLLDDKKFDNSQELKDYIVEVAKGDTKMRITVASDRTVELEKFLDIMTFLKSKGFENVDILMKKE